MRITRVKLKNIRSYREEETFFPQGSVLLAGEIGAGKSTLLHAMEFALFGLRKTRLSGKSLLRNGASEGFVELDCVIEGKLITIKRVLRQQREDVKQDAGFILVNGVKTDMTALELKAKVLELFGYPESLITKTKNLFFTYTVYTPQEEMKAVLLDDPDNRIDILRKVFGIEKYKTTRENAGIVARSLHERIKQQDFLLIPVQGKKKANDDKKMHLTCITAETAKKKGSL